MRSLVLLALVLTGCLHTETSVRTEERVVNSATSTVSLAPRFEVSATIEGDDLAITATKVLNCRDEVVESVARVETMKVGPPNGHWAILSAGAIVLAGGIVAAGVGSPMQASVPAGSLPSPVQEQQRDTGGVLVPAGAVAAGLGGALVVWDLANLFSSGTKERSSPPVMRTVQKEQRACGRSPARDYPLDLRSDGRTVDVRTDASGKARVSLAAPALKGWPLRAPFLTVSGVPVELSAQLAAKLAMAGRRSKDLAWWSSAFPHADPALRAEVDAVRLAVVEEEKAEEERGTPDAKVAAAKRVVELNKEARESLRAGERGGHSGDFADASNKAAECLALAPDNKSCRDVGTRADKALEGIRQREEKRLLSERAKQQRLEELAEAKRAAAERAEREEAQRSPKPHHIKDTALYEEGDGFVAYFSLVNASGSYMGAKGKLTLLLAFERNGFVFNKVPIAEYDVKASDFVAGTLGLGGFARSSVVWKQYISAEKLYGRFRFGRMELKQYEDDADTDINAVFSFTDVLGNTVSGRSTFHVP